MILDALLNFVTPGYPLSLVAAAGVSIPSPSVIDILGSGVGTPPQNIIGTQNAGAFGPLAGAYGDAGGMGIGTNRLLIEATMGVAAASATSATLTVAIQAAPDTGTAGGNQPGTWVTYAQTAALTAAQLTAGLTFAKLDFPQAPFPDNALPRFFRLLFQIPAATSFTAGTIANAIVTHDRDDTSNLYASKGFVV